MKTKGLEEHVGLERNQGFISLGNYKVVLTLPLNTGITGKIR